MGAARDGSWCGCLTDNGSRQYAFQGNFLSELNLIYFQKLIIYSLLFPLILFLKVLTKAVIYSIIYTSQIGH